MANPFEDPSASYAVLVNDEGQYSLWPDAIEAPEGWDTAHGPDTRDACQSYITAHWTDLRPTSLIRASERT